MTDTDIPAVSSVRVSGWQSAYAGIVPQPYLDAMSVEADTDQRRTWFALSRGRVTDLVAVDDAEVVGWAALGPYRATGTEPDAGAGELYALYVQPRLIGTGIGRALIDAVHARAADRNFTSVRLWVLADNARARRFYEMAGYTTDGAVRTDEYGGVSLRDVRYGRAIPRYRAAER